MTSTLYVVETYDGHAYLGSLASEGPDLKVMTHRVGKPVVLRMDQVSEIVSADGHPDVEVMA